MKPNSNNFCGGNYQDWVEVMLTHKCNGSCTWCVDKEGFHPKHRASWRCLAEVLEKLNRKNIILLGGEPTLYKDLDILVRRLVNSGFNVYITTNGSRMTLLSKTVYGLAGINISIHHYLPHRNKAITGIGHGLNVLKANIDHLWYRDKTPTRFNCTLIEGEIDSIEEIHKYVSFAKTMGAKSVRFAELKHDTKFVDLHALFGNVHGLTDDPYTNGCSTTTNAFEIPVSFRQMCGIQTEFRPMPIDPEPSASKKTVLYYNGILYDGWQTQNKKEAIMPKKKLSVEEILVRVKSGKMTIETASKLLEKRKSEAIQRKVTQHDAVHCQY